jgi:hypothetical protein
MLSNSPAVGLVAQLDKFLPAYLQHRTSVLLVLDVDLLFNCVPQIYFVAGTLSHCVEHVLCKFSLRFLVKSTAYLLRQLFLPESCEHSPTHAGSCLALNSHLYG